MNQREKIEAITAAAEAVTAGLELGDVLQQVVDVSRRLVRARYAALGVLDEDGERIEQFITSGIDPETRRQIGAYPEGHGLLGHIIRARQPLRVADMHSDPRAVGFPPHHPSMTSLLGVPIISKGRVFGNLYLTDKVMRDEPPDGVGAHEARISAFTAEDQVLVELFARQAAIAIENALLHRQRRQLAVAQERERFAMDLHDGIIQAIYGIGLTLDESRYQLDKDSALAKAGIDESIRRLDDVIADIRNYILNLRTRRLAEHDLGEGLQSLVRELRAHSFLTVHLTVDPAASACLPPPQSSEFLHIVQEALANIRKHARASTVRVALERQREQIVLHIIDDGGGFEPTAVANGHGNGLENMRARATALAGQIQIDTSPAAGTAITLTVPLSPEVAQN